MNILKKHLFLAVAMFFCTAAYPQQMTSSTRVVVPPSQNNPYNRPLPNQNYGQIEGRFYYYVDAYTGRNSVYFQGDNYTNSYLSIRVLCQNDRYGDRVERTVNMAPGAHFAVGMNEGWEWKEGEKLFVYYPNGQYQVWVCQRSRMVYIGSACDVGGCRCPGYVSSGGAYPTLSVCRNCGHSIKDHNY